jgi:hypothetical protein
LEFKHVHATPIAPTQSDAKPRNLVMRFVMRCGAKKRWKEAGSPVRSPERAAYIYNEICRPCEHFRETGLAFVKEHCGVCGCPLSASVDDPLANKIALATESCPLTLEKHGEPPRWEAEA